MKRFVFPLASLLNARRLQEKDARKSLGQAERHLQTQLDTLDSLEQAFRTASEERRLQAIAGMSPLALLQYDGHFLTLRARIAAQLKAVHQAEQERNRCQDALQLLYGEIKALETLREKQLAANRAESDHERDREVDEFVAYGQFQAMGNGGAS